MGHQEPEGGHRSQQAQEEDSWSGWRSLESPSPLCQLHRPPGVPSLSQPQQTFSLENPQGRPVATKDLFLRGDTHLTKLGKRRHHAYHPGNFGSHQAISLRSAQPWLPFGASLNPWTGTPCCPRTVIIAVPSVLTSTPPILCGSLLWPSVSPGPFSTLLRGVFIVANR
jgi:hypothetical protein